ncbi:AraC family transcriptional regulator [Saccharopolyspora sp. NPDC049426]|uniref:AraC family transcriptional regulator n=1 Tax=Saccharopolyspora sp. NPDC049426 TaxID=3155652 RepID=UPI003441AA6C
MSNLITPDEVPNWVPGQLTVRNPEKGWSGLSVRGYRYNGSDVEVPAVRDFVIVAYREGHTDMRRRVEGRWSSADVGPGDVSLLTRAADSRWVWSEDLDVLLVFLTEQEVVETCRQMYDRDLYDVEVQDVLQASDPGIHRTALLAAREAASGAVGSQLMIDSLSCQLAVQLLRSYAHIQFREAGAGDRLTFQQLRLVREYIREHLNEDLSLQDLAGVLALSKFHFARRFRNATGTTPHRFVFQERLERAQELMRGSGTTFAEIARVCGFADQSHMNRHFRKRFGTTPTRYRQEAAAQPNSAQRRLHRP